MIVHLLSSCQCQLRLLFLFLLGAPGDDVLINRLQQAFIAHAHCCTGVLRMRSRWVMRLFIVIDFHAS